MFLRHVSKIFHRLRCWTNHLNILHNNLQGWIASERIPISGVLNQRSQQLVEHLPKFKIIPAHGFKLFFPSFCRFAMHPDLVDAGLELRIVAWKSPHLKLVEACVNPVLEFLQLATDIVLMEDTPHGTQICPAIYTPLNDFQCSVTTKELIVITNGSLPPLTHEPR